MPASDTTPSPMTLPASPRLFAAAALALGLVVPACALLLPQWSRAQGAPLSYTGLNTALGFVLCAVALLARRRQAALCTLAGLGVLALSAAALLQPLHGHVAPSLAWQFLLNASPGATDPALWPGRMRFPVCFAFLLAGPAFLLLPAPGRKRRAAVALLGAAVAAVALPSLFANLLGNVLTGGEGATGLLLPVPTTLGLMAVGGGLFRAASPSGWAGLYQGREDRRIFVTSAALFSALSLVAGLVAIGIVGRYAMANFQQAWLTSFNSNTELFRVALAGTASRGSHLLQFVDREALPHAAPDALSRALARIALEAELDAASSVSVHGADGAVLAGVGPLRYRGQFSLALPMHQAPRLYWQDGWHVLAEQALAGGRSVRLDLALADFNRQFARMTETGDTREVRVCSRAGPGEMACFPSRLAAAPTRLPLAPGPEPLPMQLALAGETGVAAARDYRGERVIAAFGMVPGTGLGLVQKIDADEFYAPLRLQLWYALLGMAVLILAGASVLYLRTRPLVQGLVRTRARLDATLANVPAGVLTFDEAGTILSANRAAGEMFGYTGAALLGMPLARLVEDTRPLLCPEPGRLQLAGWRADGARLALEVLANEFVLDAKRKRIAIVQDVGERLRMEQALRQREASLAHAQQLAHIGSWERDLAGNTYLWSDQTYRLFGLEPGSPPPTYEEVLALVHPDDRALKQRAEADAVAGLREYDVSFRLVLPGGVVRVIHSRADVEHDAAGRPLRLRGTIQDITEKAWADEQLRKREEEYRALVEHSPDVVVRFDRSLRCVYVNPAIGRAPGLAQVVGHGRVLDQDQPAARPWIEAVGTAFAGSRAAPFEVVARGCHYQVQVVPEFRQGGQVAAVLATARDITAIRSGETLLRELSAHRERVREDERKKIAREVHDELGQALTALRMDVALLRMADGPHSPALLARVAAMKEAVDRTIGIVRNVTSALRPAALDLGLTAALEWQVEDFARRSGIECMLHTGETEVVLADDQATALFRIVQESLTNVLKHAQASHVEVTLEAGPDGISLEVSDNGRGFAAEAPAARGRFGLVGMRERVLVLGGTVQVNSAAGEGTTVSVRLPLATEQGATALQEHE